MGANADWLRQRPDFQHYSEEVEIEVKEIGFAGDIDFRFLDRNLEIVEVEEEQVDGCDRVRCDRRERHNCRHDVEEVEEQEGRCFGGRGSCRWLDSGFHRKHVQEQEVEEE